MAKVKELSTDEKLSKSIEDLSKESQLLIGERNALNERLGLVNQRLVEIQGAINALVPLVKKEDK